MHKQQSGFTLIELMIVVAIVGILASVAIPAYSDYTVRAKVTEAVAAVAPVKASVADFYYANNALPLDSAEAGLDDSTTADSVAGGNYGTDVIESIAVGAPAGAGVITVAINDIGGSTVGSETLVYKPEIGSNGQISWKCEASQGEGTLSERYAPANCRSSS